MPIFWVVWGSDYFLGWDVIRWESLGLVHSFSVRAPLCDSILGLGSGFAILFFVGPSLGDLFEFLGVSIASFIFLLPNVKDHRAGEAGTGGSTC